MRCNPNLLAQEGFLYLKNAPKKMSITFLERRDTYPTNGSSALKPAVEAYPKLSLVDPPVDDEVDLGPNVIPMIRDYVAPNAGSVARGLQKGGFEIVDRQRRRYREEGGSYSLDTAVADSNAFLQLSVAKAEGNIANISTSIRLPESVSPYFLAREIGKNIVGSEAQIARFGRKMLLMVEVDEVDYEGILGKLADAPRAMNSQFFPENESTVLNSLQDKRANDLIEEATRFKGIVEGEITPGIQAFQKNGKTHFIWDGERVGDELFGINPDGNRQNYAELRDSAPDQDTKDMLSEEFSFLMNAPKGRLRMLVGVFFDEYVEGCCITSSNLQHFGDNFFQYSGTLEISNDITNVFVNGDKVIAQYGTGGGSEFYNTKDFCSNCSEKNNADGKCVCKKES